MDLHTVTSIIPARDRADLARLAPDVAPVAGGSWVFSETQPHLTGLVDLMAFEWPAWTMLDGDLVLSSTCTLAELAAIPDDRGWAAHPLFFQACTALLGSFKVWNVATVGGNVCASLPAGPMTSLLSGLDAVALVWRADGTDEEIPVAALVTGNGQNALGVGDVVRSFRVPASSLAARTAFRKIALSPIGRSGAVVIGRLATDGAFTLTVSGATVRPEQLRYAALPEAPALEADVSALTTWFTDPHGAADWRRAVSALLAVEIRDELEEVSR